VRYLLDTDTCIYALKQQANVLTAILSHRRSELAISVITEAELRFGAAKSGAPRKTLRAVEAFLLPFELLEVTSADAEAYGEVCAKLERTGTPIGALDTILAAQAVAQKLVLVTNNEREFRRVDGLRMENWAIAA